MLYITHTYCQYDTVPIIKNIWESDIIDLEENYKQFLHREAIKRNIVINTHWYNMMNHDIHHKDLNKSEYKKAKKSWEKFLIYHSFDYYIEKYGNGIKKDYKYI